MKCRWRSLAVRNRDAHVLPRALLKPQLVEYGLSSGCTLMCFERVPQEARP